MLHLLLIFATLSCATSRFEELANFYSKFDAVKTLGEIQRTDICKMRWERIQSMLGRSNQQPDPHAALNGQSGQDLLLVHVGKAAGGSVGEMLSSARIPFSRLHGHALDARMIEGHSAILIVLRDPVQRSVSSFNWRAPGQRQKARSWERCGTRSQANFYRCFQTVDAYADKLTEISRCGQIAREGECHLELDTCAYVGGVVDSLVKHRDKVFVVDIATLVSDMNKISRQLLWNKTFSSVPIVHSNEVSAAHTMVSLSSALKLGGYLELIGEGPLYRRLKSLFQLQ